MTTNQTTKKTDLPRWIAVGVFILIAFFGAYRFAAAQSGRTSSQVNGAALAAASTQTAVNGSVALPPNSTSSGGSGSGSGGCCGNGQPPAGGVTGTETPGTATLSGGVQKISVDVTTVYNPNVIKLKAGVPAEITFSGAQGCTGYVQSQDLGFQEDLTSGPKTVKLAGLNAGTYSFACGMNMVFGKIVVE